jgi:hypothetical protein
MPNGGIDDGYAVPADRRALAFLATKLIFQ